MSHGTKPTVLLIENDVSLRRLISLGLQHRGLHVIEASSPLTIPPFDTMQLDLLIIDVDQGATSEWAFLDTVQTHTHLSTLPVVVLAWEPPAPVYHASGQVSTATLSDPQIVHLAKPFDARALHDAIDRLLQAHELQEQARTARAEEVLLAAYTAHAAPSIWPFVTAIGILLMVIGMMLQVAILVMGVLVVVVALLLWTLGTRPALEKIPAGV